LLLALEAPRSCTVRLHVFHSSSGNSTARRARWTELLVTLLPSLLVLNLTPAIAQVKPSATRANTIQVGVDFNLAHSDYDQDKLYGVGLYMDKNFTPHWGVEAEFHQLDGTGSKINIYERSYEIGPRYALQLGRFRPYIKGMFGRGVFQFPADPRFPQNGSVANLAFNMWAGGFGTDYRLKTHINLRADYELQRWSSFPPDGLSPRVLSFGVAYRFR
jgi:hypothetical protein